MREHEGTQASREVQSEHNNPSVLKSQHEHKSETNRTTPQKFNPRNILLKLLDDNLSQEQKKNRPQIQRVKNNLLLVFFLLTAYGIFYLIGQFINILLTAFIAGIAYQQTRQRFASFVMRKQFYEGSKENLAIRLFKSIILAIFGFSLPRIRYLLIHPEKIMKVRAIPSINDFLLSLKMHDNWIVTCCQILVTYQILYLLLGVYAKKIGRKFMMPKSRRTVNVLFLIISVVVIFIGVLVIPSILFGQITSVGSILEHKIEKKLGCQIIALNPEVPSPLPYCSEKISTSENQFIKQTISQFKNQNQTISKCMKFVKKIENEYIGRKILTKTEIICRWLTFVQKIYSYNDKNAFEPTASNLVMTGTNIFKTFFGNLAFIISSISSMIFSITTFLTMFYLTTKYFTTENPFEEILSEQKQQLVTSITNLIQATSLIVIEHFLFSVFLLEIFDFTQINLLISTVLSSMAFVPFFRPWFGILIVAIFRMIFVNQYYISLIFVGFYYYISEMIYSFHYKKMEINQIITNMSVLFGIYQFGFVGIFYGPLIIILYKCIEKELMN